MSAVGVDTVDADASAGADLTVEGVTARHGAVVALDDVDLHVLRGSLTSILGPSGCGKTTLLRVVAGLHQPDRGRVSVNGVIFNEPPTVCRPPEQRRIGYIPQDGALFPHLTVTANIGYALRREERPSRVAQLLEMVELQGLGKRRPYELSGGQQQRVALARALAARPQLLLLDEPFSALDGATRRSVRAEVLALIRRTGATALLVTHEPEEALSSSDMVVVMNGGRVLQSGAPDAVYRRPVDAHVARSMGEVSFVPAVIDGAGVRTMFGQNDVVPTSLSGPCLAAIRPDDVEVQPSSGACVPAEVASIEYRGDDFRVELTIDGASVVAATATRPSTPTVGVRLRRPVHVVPLT